MERNHKSLKTNAVLSSIKTLTNILFPLITYPYITNVLSVDSIGRINFSQSIVSYFSLLAALGISTFAIRTGSRIRDDENELRIFSNRIFSINIISMVISLILLTILIFLPTKIAEYRPIIIILSLTIFLSPFSVEWIFNIYEDFGYITIRNFLVHLISLILMFCFVKSEQDVYLYVALTTAATSFGNIFNYIYSKKYNRFKFTFDTHWKEYGSTILLFFVNSIASTIYLNSDTTLLGLMCSNYSVGLYSVASKIYSVLKQMFNAVVSSVIPRLSYLQKSNEDEFCKLIKRILNITILLIIPASVGVIVLRREIIILISGEEYLEATGALSILSISTIFAVVANLLCNGALVCLGRERYILRATIVSAVVNAGLNFVFIPFMKENGAALTTLLAEIIVVAMALYSLRDYCSKMLDTNEIIHSIIGSVLMYFVIGYLVYPNMLNYNMFIRIAVVIVLGILVYFVFLMCVRDKIINNEILALIRKYTKKG